MKINGRSAVRIPDEFIRGELSKFGFRKGLLGLSGGLDSSVCAALAARALGPKNVSASSCPTGQSFDRRSGRTPGPWPPGSASGRKNDRYRADGGRVL